MCRTIEMGPVCVYTGVPVYLPAYAAWLHYHAGHIMLLGDGGPGMSRAPC